MEEVTVVVLGGEVEEGGETEGVFDAVVGGGGVGGVAGDADAVAGVEGGRVVVAVEDGPFVQMRRQQARECLDGGTPFLKDAFDLVWRGRRGHFLGGVVGSGTKATTFMRVWFATGKWRMWARGPRCLCWFVAL